MSVSSKITPFLWFTHPQALHAAEFYVSVFNNNPFSTSQSSITATTRSGSAVPEGVTTNPEAGSVMIVEFVLGGLPFIAMNGNKEGVDMPWKFNEAISFQVSCVNQEEIDHFWSAITTNGGKESMCGWCKDRWGVSWQIVPQQLGELMGDADPAGKDRVSKKMFTMKKLDIAALEKAAKSE